MHPRLITNEPSTGMLRIGDLPSAPQPERPPTIAITFYFVSPFSEVYIIGFY